MAPPVHAPSRWEPPPGMPPGAPHPSAPGSAKRDASFPSSSKRRRDYEEGDDDNNHDRNRRESERGYPRDPPGQSGGGGGSGGIKQQRRDTDAPDYYGRGRDIRRERDGRSSFSRQSSGDDRWRCPECRYDNHPLDDVCRECGTRAHYSRSDGRRDGYGSSYRRQRSSSEGRYGEDRYHNERRRSEWRREGDKDDRGGVSEKRIKKENEKGKNRWPPPFESAGASYIFDTRSGLFYEASSDFFYDPKSKLYYGNKDGKYFQYCSGEEPPFRAVNQQSAAGQTKEAVTSTTMPHNATSSYAEAKNVNTDILPSTLTSDVSGNTAGGGADKKNKIAICLKKKSSGVGTIAPNTVSEEVNTAGSKENRIINAVQPKVSATTSGTSPGHISSSRAQKKHEANIEKWSVRGKEMRGAASATSNSETVTEPQTKSLEETKQPMPQSSMRVTKTKTGHPICFLCKRKFADIEKLRQHERVSALHKQNLAKKAASEAQVAKKEQSPASGAMEYRDRAKERRFLYGPEQTVSLLENDTERDVRTVNSSEVVKPGENLGDSNIGNQLLQKLGWKAGSSLGRKQQGGNSSSCEEGQQPQAPATTDHLRKDWERIESMAGGMNSHRMGAKGKGVGG